jgi:hypothetical protein
MMIGIPLLQLTLFGFAINGDPKHLPTMVVVQDESPFTRSLVTALRLSDYFAIRAPAWGPPRPASSCRAARSSSSSPFRPALRGPCNAVSARCCDGGRCHRSQCDRQRHQRHALLSQSACSTICKDRWPRWPGPEPIRAAHSSPLQSGRDHPIQHGTRPDGGDPDHDHDHDDGAGHHRRWNGAPWRICCHTIRPSR